MIHLVCRQDGQTEDVDSLKGKLEEVWAGWILMEGGTLKSIVWYSYWT